MDKGIVQTELQMLTGSTSKDISYLYYLLIRDGSYFKQENEPKVVESENTVKSLEDWFNSL